MTITEYRNILFEKIGKTGGGIAEGLKEALELSENLYDSYDDEGNYVHYMTNRELAEMLAKGYGQVTLWGPDYDEYGTKHNDSAVETQWSYFDRDEDYFEVPRDVRSRQWGSEVWNEPLASIYKAWTMGTLVSIKED